MDMALTVRQLELQRKGQRPNISSDLYRCVVRVIACRKGLVDMIPDVRQELVPHILKALRHIQNRLEGCYRELLTSSFFRAPAMYPELILGNDRTTETTQKLARRKTKPPGYQQSFRVWQNQQSSSELKEGARVTSAACSFEHLETWALEKEKTHRDL